MKKWIAAGILLSISTALLIAKKVTAGGIKLQAIEHTLSIVQRPDGQYDVTCLDGVAEIKSKADVLGNRLCTHLRTYAGRWVLIEGGIDNGSRFCDLDMNLIRSDTAIVKLRVGFSSPCAMVPVETQQCQGLVCSAPLNGRYFNFDFSIGGRVTLTRLDDGFTAAYRGNAGAGGGGVAGNARLTELNGVLNILQTTNDNGATWLSVCDDSFGQEEATVACRELGFRGSVQSMTTGVYVAGDASFGWDDLTCLGSETSLAECRHTAWGSENCDEAEHVQLICAP